jgi:endoglucanase
VVRRGINLGNTLDALSSNPGRLAVIVDHLDVIRGAGFDTVRLPVAWSEHASVRAPYEISPQFFSAVETMILGALERDLSVVVDVHHYNDLCANPETQGRRFLALWAQIAERFADMPSTVRFELLNEPQRRLTGPRWNDLLAEALAVVRERNPHRDVIVGPAEMNTIAGLGDLELPADDHPIVTIHYYLPLPFTHQGAYLWPHALDWLITRWGTPTDRDNVRRDLAAAATWTRQRHRRLFIGEFGTYRLAPPEGRAAWTAHVRATADQLDIPWCYWDFATDFGVYDAGTRRWNESLRAACSQPESSAPQPLGSR